MKTYIYVNKQENIDNKQFEVVETKGKGHPDNICDTLAEKISGNYSKYCLNKYGVVLRHMIDKLSILGGGSKVQFGKGEMLSPIRILINGRFTDRYGEEKIVRDWGDLNVGGKKHFIITIILNWATLHFLIEFKEMEKVLE